MKKRNIQIITIFLIGITINSCGVFLQKTKDFVLQARKYLSNFHNQHTNIHLKSEFKNVYPFTINISYDNWYLLNIDKKQDSLYIGKQIEKINGIDINEIENKLVALVHNRSINK